MSSLTLGGQIAAAAVVCNPDAAQVSDTITCTGGALPLLTTQAAPPKPVSPVLREALLGSSVTAHGPVTPDLGAPAGVVASGPYVADTVSYPDGSSAEERVWTEFDFSALPAGSVILSATLDTVGEDGTSWL